jgi:predicted metal-binding membrane protein
VNAAGLLLRDRVVASAALAALVALSWAYLVMGAGMEMPGMGMPMVRPEWTPGYFAVMCAMWLVMMAAMMLPSAAPMILLHLRVSRERRARGGAPLASGLFVLGYIAVWTAFSGLATAMQWALGEAAQLSPILEAQSPALAGALLIAAGLYQLTPLKHACLRHCRSPLDFVMTHWREGRAGALAMGLRHGAYCLGCCWMLMLLLFVGGVMNLVWIAVLAAFVLVEKLFPGGHWVARLAGFVLLAWGGAALLGAA